PFMTAACGVPAFPWHPESSALLDRRPAIPISPPSTTAVGTDHPHEEAPGIELRGLRKVSGETAALADIDLTVPARETPRTVGRPSPFPRRPPPWSALTNHTRRRL